MTHFRVIHNKNYTCINNTICTDKRISWKAKGIWLYAFSRPDDWQFHLNDLINQSTDRRDAVQTGLKELEKFGYLRRTKIRCADGTIGCPDWTFFEVPQDLKEIVPQTGFPSTDKPSVENPPLSSTEVPSTEDLIDLTAAQAAELQEGAIINFATPKGGKISRQFKLLLAHFKELAFTQAEIEYATRKALAQNPTIGGTIEAYLLKILQNERKQQLKEKKHGRKSYSQSNPLSGTHNKFAKSKCLAAGEKDTDG